ncbi:hypothetical protein ACIBTZ_15130 [Micromonospora sp. NPDC049460]|uniref:hypothetical protein n=1 Tax=Micromonospora sp. NPDC049460 TaxID=3364272 RepID=UPI0037944A6D
MLPTLQFTDFHKFLVSAGGLTVGVGFGFPVLLLRNQAVLGTTQAQLQALPPESRSAVRLQQEQMTFLLQSWPYISGFLIFAGLGLVGWGAVAWKKQQNRTDNREIAELAKLEADREKTYQETLLLLREHQGSPEEVQEQREEEAAEVVSSEEGIQLKGTEATTQDSHAAPADQTEGSNVALPPPTQGYRSGEYLHQLAETGVKLAVEAFESAYGRMVDIVPNVRFGNYFADFVVTSRRRSLPDLAVDIKFLGTGNRNTRNRVRDAIVWAMQVKNLSPKEFQTKIVPVVIMIHGYPSGSQESLFDTPDAGRSISRAADIASQELAAAGLEGLNLPLIIAFSSTGQIPPHALRDMDWHTPGPRVIVLK